MYNRKSKYRINENLSWRSVVKKIYDLGNEGLEDFGLYLLSSWEHDFLLSLAEYLADNPLSTLSERQQETVLKIKSKILSTMDMLESNDDALKQYPNPYRLNFAKQEVQSCYAAGLWFKTT